MPLLCARVLLVLALPVLIGVMVIVGAIAGPVIGIAWLLQDVKQTLRTL